MQKSYSAYTLAFLNIQLSSFLVILRFVVVYGKETGEACLIRCVIQFFSYVCVLEHVINACALFLQMFRF